MDHLLATPSDALLIALTSSTPLDRGCLPWRSMRPVASSYLAGREASRRVASHTATRPGTPDASAKKTAGRQKS